MQKKRKLDTKKKRKITSEMKMVSLIMKGFRDLGPLLEKMKKSKNNTERNEIQVALIKSGLRDLKKEIEDMDEQEKETEKPNKIVDIVKNIFEFNRQ